MKPVKNLIGEYEDEVAKEVRKAKGPGCAKDGKKIVDNIL